MKQVFKIIETGDVHGCCFPYDFVNQCPVAGSMSAVSTFVQKIRNTYHNHLLVFDNGDLLQGQPVTYYYNFIDQQSEHIMASVLNDIQYDAVSIGNHDIEIGQEAYSRWSRDCKASILAANLVDEHTLQPLYKPYEVFVRDGVRIAVLGMVTPCIPYWLPLPLWKGMKFLPILETTRKWMDIIQQKEKPHLVIGLFHSGWDNGIENGNIKENATQEVATQVPGFDLIFYGHDHMRKIDRITNCEGKTVLCLNPSDKAHSVSEVHIEMDIQEDKVVKKHVIGRIRDINDMVDPHDSFGIKHSDAFHAVNEFVSEQLGYLQKTLRSRDAFFGPALYIDFIHTLQLQITEADISFAAPLSFDDVIEKGPLQMGDLFKMYRYENPLYTLYMTGREVKNYLEMSYALWTVQMTSPDDHLLSFIPSTLGNPKPSLAHLFYNYDSAAGIRYTVDVTRPEGDKVCIKSMADGTPFDLDKRYVVVTSSYRSNGGGELMTKGAGIPHEELSRRMIKATDKDMRYYMMRYIQKNGAVLPVLRKEWKFIPEDWVKKAVEKDRKLLF